MRSKSGGNGGWSRDTSSMRNMRNSMGKKILKAFKMGGKRWGGGFFFL